VPAATVTTTAIDWPTGYVIAPDAFYHRALVHFDIEARTLDIYNLQGAKQATYTLTEGHTFDDDRKELRGTLPDGGDILARPESGCACLGYKRTPR
jgi:hypothetical protein